MRASKLAGNGCSLILDIWVNFINNRTATGMRVIAPLVMVIAVSALAILEAGARGNPTLWFQVFRTVGWLAIVGMLILIYEKTGTRKLAYTGIVILTLLGILFILIGLLAFFAKLYLFSVPIIIIGGLWVWFIMSRYERYKEASK